MNLLSSPRDLHILDALYKWVIQLCFFYLSPSQSPNALKAPLLCNTYQCFILFYGQMLFHHTDAACISVHLFNRRWSYLRGLFDRKNKVQMKASSFLYHEVKHPWLSLQVEGSHAKMKTGILLMFLWGLACALPVSIMVEISTSYTENNIVFSDYEPDGCACFSKIRIMVICLGSCFL